MCLARKIYCKIVLSVFTLREHTYFAELPRLFQGLYGDVKVLNNDVVKIEASLTVVISGGKWHDLSTCCQHHANSIDLHNLLLKW